MMNEFKEILTSMYLCLKTLPSRLRHAYKHRLWINEDENGMYCTLCNRPLTGEDSWRLKWQ